MSSNDREQAVFVPPLCPRCQKAVLDGAGIGERGPWRAAMAVAQVALFQLATQDRRVVERCGLLPDGTRDARDLSLVLAEIGCLGCFLPEGCARIATDIGREGVEEFAARIKTSPYGYDPEKGGTS